jgi:hypothetical protein
MLNTLTSFEKLKQEHEVIQANTRLISGSADNLLVLSNLQNNALGLSVYQMDYLGDKRVNLRRAISSLRDGLLEHFKCEEEILGPLVGALVRVIKKEHQEVLDKLTEIDWILLNISPAGILYNSSFLKLKIDVLCHILNANCLREDSVLELLLKLTESYN